jgi:hypothetical protein
MIWFACKQCGKRHGRPDELTGTLVFCECGHGNRVPWSSTVEPPAEPEPAPAPRRPLPAEPAGPRREPELPLPRRRQREFRRNNPNFCFNHDDVASEKTCDACRLRFCASCVVEVEGKTLCGPCKNFRVAAVGRPARSAPMAIVALVVSLVSVPVTLFLTLAAIGMQAQGMVGVGVLFCLVGLILPVAGLVLAGLALREIETKPHVGGRSLVTSGGSAALVGVLWGVTLALLILLK